MTSISTPTLRSSDLLHCDKANAAKVFAEFFNTNESQETAEFQSKIMAEKNQSLEFPNFLAVSAKAIDEE